MRAVAWTILLCACGGPPKGSPDGGDAFDSGAPPDTGPEPTGCYDVPIELTGGFGHYGEPFEPAPPVGAVATMVHGIQGPFWHIDTGIRLTSVHTSVSARPTVTLVSSGALISGRLGGTTTNESFLQLAPEGECAGSSVALRAFLDDVDPDEAVVEELVPHICPLDGEEVDITWEVRDLVDQRTATATVRATLALDPVDVPTCAAR
ncbi:MAG: hypothetical protein H0V89_06930 [Deltaproteobacteria bacterium]|nr:hypothetical protein [Deltaproteobacteria bacterium]